MSACETTRAQLLDGIRGRLATDEQQRFERHLQGCAECSKISEREHALDRALNRLPRHALPNAVRERLTAQITNVRPKAKRQLGRAAAVLVVPSLMAALLALFVVRTRVVASSPLVDEAVRDHLRVLYAEHPVEIESGGVHQVKPWFAGRLDFAPVLDFSGDDEFPLQGGAIGLFVDRKAATFIFKHRLHTATLFVFRGDGLSWPLFHNSTLGSLACTSAQVHGFNTLLWREGDLGYALVSDVDELELRRLGIKVSTH